MIYTVSTVKDTTANIETFVHRNLTAGVDHLFVFLEGEEAQRQAAEIAGAHVTALATDADYWQGARPQSLNRRQMINAGLVTLALSPLPWADWLFHIDGDESLYVDTSYLAEVPAHTHVVGLAPLEAVARREWPGEVTHFKRLLSKAELSLLHERGSIARPINQEYFQGHVTGKVGVRPSPFVTLSVHKATTQHGARLSQHRDPRLRMLHYDSHTLAEFVRKWDTMLGAGNTSNRRAVQGRIADGVHAALAAPSTERERLLAEVFDELRADDLETLDGLGLLVAPELVRHTPTAHTQRQAEQLTTIFDQLVRADRSYFDVRERRFQTLDLLHDLEERLRRPPARADLADLVADAVTRH